jgi:hypothetical protein
MFGDKLAFESRIAVGDTNVGMLHIQGLPLDACGEISPRTPTHNVVTAIENLAMILTLYISNSEHLKFPHFYHCHRNFQNSTRDI